MNEKHLVIYVEGYVINRLVSSLSQLQAFSFLNYRLISMNANSKSTDWKKLRPNAVPTLFSHSAPADSETTG
jgi:hypothetical protein